MQTIISGKGDKTLGSYKSSFNYLVVCGTAMRAQTGNCEANIITTNITIYVNDALLLQYEPQSNKSFKSD